MNKAAKGYHIRRLNMTNKQEVQFSLEWESMNEHGDALDQILSKGAESCAGELKERDRRIAATVIQWLGSAVGESFINNARERKV